MRILSFWLIALFTAVALPAAAQLSQLGGGQGGQAGQGGFGAGPPGGIKPATGDAKPVIAPPAAVPGAKPRPDSVTPLRGGTNDLPPTEALFDAINRGDITSARDSINRGADLDSTNLLGLTPIELSVDLGRNDISFLLLSLRGASGSGQARRQPATAAAPPAERPARHAPALAPAPHEAARSVRGPALFAGNGGAAIPSAGFLGFDPHH